MSDSTRNLNRLASALAVLTFFATGWMLAAWLYLSAVLLRSQLVERGVHEAMYLLNHPWLGQILNPYHAEAVVMMFVYATLAGLALSSIAAVTAIVRHFVPGVNPQKIAVRGY